MHFVLCFLSTPLSTLLSILRRNQQKSFSFLMHFYMKIFTNPPSWTLFFEISPSKQTWTTQRTSGNVCISGCVGPKRQKIWWAGASLKNWVVYIWRQKCCWQILTLSGELLYAIITSIGRGWCIKFETGLCVLGGNFLAN